MRNGGGVELLKQIYNWSYGQCSCKYIHYILAWKRQIVHDSLVKTWM